MQLKVALPNQVYMNKFIKTVMGGKPIKICPLTSVLFKAKFAWAIGVKIAGFSS